jgi:hypothetical protein
MLAPRLLNSKGDIVAAAPKVFSKLNAGMRAQLLDCSWERGLVPRGVDFPSVAIESARVNEPRGIGWLG